jgi:MCM2/3/5 family protein/bifunctional DNA primase/polymerase-like protein
MTNNRPETFTEWLDYWYYTIGANITPAITRQKYSFIPWKEWQSTPIPEETYKTWKESNKFKHGAQVLAGKLHRGKYAGKYLIFVDLDNRKAIDELCQTSNPPLTLEQLAKTAIVEQHADNPNKAHVYFISEIPFPKKSSDVKGDLGDKIAADEIPAIEIKGEGSHGVALCSPSYHKSGHQYRVIGTIEPIVFNEKASEELKFKLDAICQKYGIGYLNNVNSRGLVPIQQLFASDFKVLAGHNRHEALMRAMESLMARKGGIMTEDQVWEDAWEWNETHCEPPLPKEEFEKQWIAATKWILRNGNYIPANIVGAHEITRYIAKENIGKEITLQGTINAIEPIQQILVKDVWECANHKHFYDEERDKCKDKECIDEDGNRSRVIKKIDQETLRNQRYIELVLCNGLDITNDQYRVWVSLTDSLTDEDLRHGDAIRVRGIARLTESNIKQPIKNQIAYFSYVEAKAIAKLDKEGIVITDFDREKIKEWSETQGDKLVDELVASYAPHIYGHEIVKESLLYSIVDADYDGNDNKTDINILVIADPSEGKTQLVEFGAEISGGYLASGESISKVGISIGLVKDENLGRYVKKAGIAILANGKTKWIDEFDKMEPENRPNY